MSNPSKRKGSQWEADLVEYFRQNDFEAEHILLRGRNDEGDVLVRDGGLPIVIEAKNEERFDLSGYIREMEREHLAWCLARGQDPDAVGRCVIVKRRMKGPGQAYVVTTVDDYFGIKP
jgi:Holliday junction resolvase